MGQVDVHHSRQLHQNYGITLHPDYHVFIPRLNRTRRGVDKKP
jgi:hypothetical protein